MSYISWFSSYGRLLKKMIEVSGLVPQHTLLHALIRPYLNVYKQYPATWSRQYSGQPVPYSREFNIFLKSAKWLCTPLLKWPTWITCTICEKRYVRYGLKVIYFRRILTWYFRAGAELHATACSSACWGTRRALQTFSLTIHNSKTT